jgi:putative transcriptional regulator
VGVVQEPVDGRGRQGFGHQLIERGQVKIARQRDGAFLARGIDVSFLVHIELFALEIELAVASLEQVMSGLLDMMFSNLDTGVMGRTSARGRRSAVRVARTALGMTQADLASEVGVTRQTVIAVEAGDYAPSVYLALAIAGRLGGTVERLFGDELEADRPGLSNNGKAGP